MFDMQHLGNYARQTGGFNGSLLTWYLTWCGCTTGSSWSISSGDIVSVHAAIGLCGLRVHEEIHLFTPDLF